MTTITYYDLASEYYLAYVVDGLITNALLRCQVGRAAARSHSNGIFQEQQHPNIRAIFSPESVADRILNRVL